jgi:ribonucleotide reductase alpha subunit
MTIKIDLTRDSLFDSLGLQRLKESYMKDDEVSPQERFAFVSEAFSSNPEHAQRLYEYSSKHWLSYSTPILSFGRSKRGLPISCFLNYMDDSAEGLVANLSETNWLSMLGGGVGVHLGIRNSDDKSTGVMPHLKMYDASSLAYRQGRTRRGSYAAFLDVSHPKSGMAIDGVMSKLTNRDIFKYIKKECERADNNLVLKRGACPDAAEFGIERRFSHHMAIAPNASSSLIMGNTSPSIEPYRANVFRQDTLSGAHVYRNRFLVKRLAELGLDNDDTWASIIAHDGSVQHLDIPEDVKEVFKTAMEIDQRWLVELAADRQEFIDQGQSVNLFFQPNTTIAYLHAVHFMAWKQGLKSLYYLRSDKVRKAEKVGAQVKRQRIEETIDMTAIANGETCLACEG